MPTPMMGQGPIKQQHSSRPTKVESEQNGINLQYSPPCH